MSILECLQDAGFSETATLSEQCEQLVWDFKVKITQDERFVSAAKQYCEEELKGNAAMNLCTSQTQPGFALSCLMEFTKNVTETGKCHAFLGEYCNFKNTKFHQNTFKFLFVLKPEQRD